MKTTNAMKPENRTPVIVLLHPVEYGIFTAAAKERGHAPAQDALQEWIDDGKEVLDFQNSGFQIA